MAEFGTSFGISILHLAAALGDNTDSCPDYLAWSSV